MNTAIEVGRTESARVDETLDNLEELVEELAGSEEAETRAPKRRLRLAYLTTEYPKASHTFVRRELLALEKLGHDITRVSIRGGSAIVDPSDQEEAEQTTYLLGQSKRTHLMSLLRTMVCRPRRFARACSMSLSMWRVSNRSWFRHVAYLLEATTLLWILRRRNVEHLHVHFGKNAADVARVLQCLGGPTYSMMIHGPGEFDAPRGFSLGAKVRDSRFTAAITSYATAQLRRWVGYEHWNKLHVVRCTINDDFLSQYQPQTADTNQFVCIGRLTGQKGQLLLIDAVASLVRDGVDVKLVLAGDGEMRSVIEDRIREHQIEKHVEITGWIGEADVRRHLLESRAMVLPSFAEGLPVAIMEAFALGRPVISSCITGIPELLRDGENGWLITSGCVDEIASAMRDAIETPLERLNEMAKSGHEAVRRNHHAETEAAKLEQLLLEFC